MKYLSRHKVYEKVEPFKNAKKIYIFCEGETKEVDYFRFFSLIDASSMIFSTGPQKKKKNNLTPIQTPEP